MTDLTKHKRKIFALVEEMNHHWGRGDLADVVYSADAAGGANGYAVLSIPVTQNARREEKLMFKIVPDARGFRLCYRSRYRRLKLTEGVR